MKTETTMSERFVSYSPVCSGKYRVGANSEGGFVQTELTRGNTARNKRGSVQPRSLIIFQHGISERRSQCIPT